MSTNLTEEERGTDPVQEFDRQTQSSPAQEPVAIQDFNKLSETRASSSPVQEPQTMDFPDAMREIIEGKSVTKLEWNDPRIYLAMHDNRLSIHKANDTWHILQVSDGDVFGEDWVVI